MHPGAELDSGAHDISAGFFIGPKAMPARPRIKQNARLANQHGPALGLGHSENAAAQNVQMSDIFRLVASGDAA